MRKRDQIKTTFNDFVDSIEKNDLTKLSSFFTAEAVAHLSTVGEKKGGNDIANGLVVKEEGITLRRYMISNFVVRTDGNHARQSAYVMALVGKDDGKFLFSFEYGGKFLVDWKRSGDDATWQIDELWYDLDWVKGNTSYVKDWTLIDYNIYSGHQPMISSEFDSPWACITKNDEALTDEEQIIENMFKYSFGLDNCDWVLHGSSYTTDVCFHRGQIVDASCAKRLINNFKNTSHKESALEHAIKIVKVVVDGDEAVLYGSRIEPHRLGSKILCRTTLCNNFYTAKYVNKLRKVDGQWKMYDLDYRAHVDFDTNPRPTHYYDDIEGTI